MSLPRVKIQFLNGSLGTVPESSDGLLLMVCNGAAVSTTFALNTAYEIKRLEALTALGVNDTNNPTLYKMVSEFYSEAPDGTRVVVAAVPAAVTVPKMVNKTIDAEENTGFVRSILEQYKGEIRGVVVAYKDATAAATTHAIAEDVLTALPLAQQLAEWAATDLHAPIFVILEGRNYSGFTSDLTDLTANAYNRVGIMLGGTAADGSASVGMLAGRIAVSPVQRNVGRVKDGALFPSQLYLGDKLIETVMDDVETVYDKGYIVARTYAGKAGYFFVDDLLCTARTDDYASLANRRVADKAARIAYITLLNFMLDEIELNSDGTMQPAIAAYWQQSVVSAIDKQMTANGELSADDSQSGCKCLIDTTQNVASTSKVNVTLKIRPYGYAREINVELGFLVE